MANLWPVDEAIGMQIKDFWCLYLRGGGGGELGVKEACQWGCGGVGELCLAVYIIFFRCTMMHYKCTNKYELVNFIFFLNIYCTLIDNNDINTELSMYTYFNVNASYILMW